MACSSMEGKILFINSTIRVVQQQARNNNNVSSSINNSGAKKIITAHEKGITALECNNKLMLSGGEDG